MTIKIRALLAILLCGISLSTYADVYEYIDEMGSTHFSDARTDERYVLIFRSDDTAITDDALLAETTHQKDSSVDVSALRLTPTELLNQIAQSALNNQLDGELIHAVMHVESAYKVKARSSKGAQGLMQLMPATANRLGVKNIHDPAQNIEGGARYLRELLNLFKNDVSLAVAAYNAGENAVIKYGNKIPPYKETQAYVPKVVNIYQALLKQRQRVIQ